MSITLTLQRMTPDAVPAEAPSSRILAAFEQRAHYARTGRQDGAGPAGHALTALALLVALVDRLTAQRWALVEAALKSGAQLADVAAAQGLDVEEVRLGYGRAVDDRLMAGHLMPVEAAELYRLVADGPEAADR